MAGKFEVDIVVEFTRLEYIEVTEIEGIIAFSGVIVLFSYLNKVGISWVIVIFGFMSVARARYKIVGFFVLEVFVIVERVKRGKLEFDAYLLGA